MSEHHQRVVLDGIDWQESFPFLRLFRSLSMAINPGRLLLSLLLILLLYLGGTAMDFAWGERVNPRELQAYSNYDSQRYADWLEKTSEDSRTGKIFETLVDQQVAAFEELIVSATSLNFGLSDFASGQGMQSGGVIGALAKMIVHIPGWLYATHPLFLIVYLLYAFALTTLIGAAISRVAAMDACRGEHTSAFEGLRFGLSNWIQVMLAPLIPLAIVVVIRLLLVVLGWVFFNVMGLEIIGAVLYGLLLLLGFLATLLLIGLILGVNLLTPAIAVEGTDAFDAVSRAYNYVVGRFWRYVLYTAILIVYGAIAYMIIGLIVFSTILMTRNCLAAGAISEVSNGVTRLDVVMPEPRFGELLAEPNWDELDKSGTVTAAFISVWNRLLIAILPAFAVSYFFNAQTWVYLLLRRSADLVEFDEIYVEQIEGEQNGSVGDKIEPGSIDNT